MPVDCVVFNRAFLVAMLSACNMLVFGRCHVYHLSLECYHTNTFTKRKSSTKAECHYFCRKFDLMMALNGNPSNSCFLQLRPQNNTCEPRGGAGGQVRGSPGIRIHPLRTMNVCMQRCSNTSGSCWDILLDEWKHWPAGGTRRKAGASTKSLGFIGWEPDFTTITVEPRCQHGYNQNTNVWAGA